MKSAQMGPWNFSVTSRGTSQINWLSDSLPLRQAKKTATFRRSGRKPRPSSLGIGSFSGLSFELPEALKVPLLIACCAALALLLLSLLGWVLLTRSSVRQRDRVYLVPNESFEPSQQAIEQFASTLTRTRKLGVPKASSATRILLESHADGEMSYAVEFPHAAAAAITAGGYPKVAAVQPDPATGRLPTTGGAF